MGLNAPRCRITTGILVGRCSEPRRKDYNQYCDNWLELPMSEQKINVTSEQLGQLLFGFVSTHTTGRLKDAEYLRSLGVEHIDQGYLLREMLLINMFAIVQGLNGLLENAELETNVLDHMHKTYYQALVEYLKVKPKNFPNEHAHLLERY